MNDQLHIVPPTEEHTHTMILLHGRDSNNSDFCSELFESQATNDLTLPEIYPNFKWIFPNSGLRNAERFSTQLSQWFDMWSTENPYERDNLCEEGLHAAVAFITEVIEQESQNVPRDRIFLGGISQGGATALQTLLHGDFRLAGVIGFSTWLPFPDSLHVSAVSDASPTTPVFLAHCEDDEVINSSYGEQCRDKLSSQGMGVNWYTYEDGGHWINEPQGIDDVMSFVDWCIRRSDNRRILDNPCFLEKKEECRSDGT